MSGYTAKQCPNVVPTINKHAGCQCEKAKDHEGPCKIATGVHSSFSWNHDLMTRLSERRSS